jgi:hypothetical protein
MRRPASAGERGRGHVEALPGHEDEPVLEIGLGVDELVLALLVSPEGRAPSNLPSRSAPVRVPSGTTVVSTVIPIRFRAACTRSMAKRGFPASFVKGVHGVDPRCSAGFSGGVVVCAAAAVAIRVATTASRSRRA